MNEDLMNDLEGEIWRAIPGYEGLYEASTEGRIRSLDRHTVMLGRGGRPYDRVFKGKILKGSYDEDGYLDVDLYDGVNRQAKTCRVNRLVALTFLPNPNNLPQVDHLNCVKDDNRACNLEWVTCKENINRAWSAGRCHGPKITEEWREKHRFYGKLTRVMQEGRPCRCVEDNTYFLTILDLCRHYNIRETIARQCVLEGRVYEIDSTHQLHFELVSKDCEEYQKLLANFKEEVEKLKKNT